MAFAGNAHLVFSELSEANVHTGVSDHAARIQTLRQCSVAALLSSKQEHNGIPIAYPGAFKAHGRHLPLEDVARLHLNVGV